MLWKWKVRYGKVETSYDESLICKSNLSIHIKIMESFLKNDKELPKSYYEQAIIYLKNGKTDQAILQAQLAKRKLNSLMKDDNVRLLAENIDLLLVEAYHKSKKSEDALSIIEEIEISSDENK